MAKKKKSDLLYIMNPNCGWCKKADPVVDELKKDGHKITTLNVTEATDGKKASEVTSKVDELNEQIISLLKSIDTVKKDINVVKKSRYGKKIWESTNK